MISLPSKNTIRTLLILCAASFALYFLILLSGFSSLILTINDVLSGNTQQNDINMQLAFSIGNVICSLLFVIFFAVALIPKKQNQFSVAVLLIMTELLALFQNYFYILFGSALDAITIFFYIVQLIIFIFTLIFAVMLLVKAAKKEIPYSITKSLFVAFVSVYCIFFVLTFCQLYQTLVGSPIEFLSFSAVSASLSNFTTFVPIFLIYKALQNAQVCKRFISES
ncbi:MAG: hypothetical protein RR389_07785 [Christensenella sp.]